MSVWVWVGVALLGGIGTSGRFLLHTLIDARVSGDFPVGTLVVNTTGALLLGVLSGLALQGDALLLAGAATVGSYTTFSTWMLETQRLAEDGALATAAINIVLSLAVGLAAVALGHALGAHI